MSLNDLTKEQKQYAALGLLAASIAVILMVLGIRFSMATVSAAKEELDDLSSKISKANRALSRSRKTSRDYVETATVLRDYLTNAPPERNYYSWATEVIYSTARFAGLEIDSIDEISIPRQQLAGSDAPAEISFESYSLRIVAHGGYENTKYFLNLLHQDYPLVRFAGVEISSGQNRDTHDVQLFIQWPFNFGEISKNWDALASRKIQVADSRDGEETALLAETETENKPVAPQPSVTKSAPVREPYPPTTRPEAEITPAPEPRVEKSMAATQPGREVDAQRAPSSGEPVPKPEPDEESEAILPYAAPSEAEITDDELQRETTVSGPMTEPIPEQEDISAEPEVVSDPDPESMIGQEELPLVHSAETPDSLPASVEPHVDDLLDAEPQLDAFSALEVGSEPEALVGPQPDSAADETGNDVSTGISEKNIEEGTNQVSAAEDVSMSSLLEDMMGESNEE